MTTIAPDDVRIPASPVLTAGAWFDADGRPLTLRMELPLSAEAMVAALYFEDSGITPDDLATAEDVWGQVACILVDDGRRAVERRAADLRIAEAQGMVTADEWLAFCRQRVAEAIGEHSGAGQ